MSRHKTVAPAFTGVLFASMMMLTACETQLQQEADVSVQTKNALEVLPPTVRIVGMLNTKEASANHAFNPLMRLGTDDVDADVNAQFEDFLDATGFDPREDLEAVYAGVEFDGSEGVPMLVAYASYTPSRLREYLNEHSRGELNSATYRDVTVYSTDADHQGMHFALASESMMVAAASSDVLHSMLDRLIDGGPALESEAHVMSLIRKVGGGSGWVVVSGLQEIMDNAEAPIEQADRDFALLAKAVTDVAVTVNIDAGGLEGTTYMIPRDDVSADDLASLTRGVVAALKTASKNDANAMAALDAVEVRERRGEVTVSFEFDNEVLQTRF